MSIEQWWWELRTSFQQARPTQDIKELHRAIISLPLYQRNCFSTTYSMLALYQSNCFYPCVSSSLSYTLSINASRHLQKLMIKAGVGFTQITSVSSCSTPYDFSPRALCPFSSYASSNRGIIVAIVARNGVAIMSIIMKVYPPPDPGHDLSRPHSFGWPKWICNTERKTGKSILPLELHRIKVEKKKTSKSTI